jgi:putative multiple sugar transport system permease protein
MNNVKSSLSKNAMSVVLILTLLFFQVLLMSSDRGSLFTPQNISNLIAQNAYVAILATGMLLCILTGGNIDLSVGSIIILVGAFAGYFIVEWGVNPYLAMLLCLIVGACLGAWQAFWIAFMRIPPFIVTLAGMLTFRGLALIMMDSQNIGPFPTEFKALFNNYIPSSWVENNPQAVLSISLIIAAVVCAVMITVTMVSRVQKQKKGYAT